MASTKKGWILRKRRYGKSGFKKGHTSWNKGMTKETDERLKKMSKLKSGEKNWMFGKKHSEETIQKMKEHKLSAKPKLFGTPLERHMFFIKLFFLLPFRYQMQWIHELFVRGAWRDGKNGLRWTRLRINARRMRELKAEEMKTTGRIPEVPIAPSGDYDPRILASPLQKS
ncbi:hypothetical protein LCGC14_2373950, partial [marine sediment metagenome]